MSAYREAHLSCDGRDEAGGVRRYCFAQFRVSGDAGLGFVSSFTVLRRHAKKAGWSYVRWPSRTRFLDKDFCPAHKPPAKPGVQP